MRDRTRRDSGLMHRSSNFIFFYAKKRRVFFYMFKIMDLGFLSNPLKFSRGFFKLGKNVLSSIVNNSGLAGCQSRTVYSTNPFWL